MYVYYFGLPLLMVAAVVDASVMAQLRVYNGQPSLILMLVISWVLLNDLPDALPWAVMGGIFADLMSVTPTGTSSLGLVLASLAVANTFGRVGRRNILFPPLAIVIGTLIYQAVVLIILFGVGYSVPPVGAVLRWTLPSVIYNFVGILLVFRLLGLVVEFFRPPTAPAF